MIQWRDKAACLGEDPTIFHRLSGDDPGCAGMTETERKDLERENFVKAKALCESCPVRQECRNEGARFDFGDKGEFLAGNQFSVWGDLPRGYSGKKKGRPRNTEVCKNGHVGMYSQQANGRKCRGCQADYDRERRGKNASSVLTFEELHAKAGHDHELELAFFGKRKVCRECKRRVNRKYSASKLIGPHDYDARHRALKGHEPEWMVQKAGKRCRICQNARSRLRRAG